MKSNNFIKRSTPFILLTALLFVTSCADLLKYRPYARNVKKKPHRSGVIALKIEHRKEDRDLAMSYMKENCGRKKVEITDEGEVVIGTTTSSSTDSYKGGKKKVGSFFGIPVTSTSAGSEKSTSTTLQQKEWQITYKCK